jgi:pyruvate ferredoxin oxidoreductase gamma subunit
VYRIRIHGRGGHGIKTGARILGSAFFAEGFEVQDAPHYGAERRGAPIDASVRAARAAIRERGMLRAPDLVVVADDTLVTVAASGVFAGVTDRTWLLLRSSTDAEVWRRRLARPGRVLALPSETGDAAAFLGSSCAAAAARLVGVIGWPAFETALRAELPREAAAAESVRRARAAWDALAAHAGCVAEGPATIEAPRDPEWIDVPLDPAEIAAPDVRTPLTSLEVRTGLWRTQRPVIEAPRCHGCAWICSTLCPDGAIAIDAAGRPQVDYDHCKGCMVCVAVCPHHAIRVEREDAGERAALEPQP